MTRIVLASLLAALALAPVAEAKKITGFEVCGAQGCRDRSNGLPGEEVAFGSGSPVAAPARAAWYSVRATIDTGSGRAEGSQMAYVPARRMLRLPGEYPGQLQWFAMSDAQVRAYERLVRGVRPYPAARLRLTGATVPTTEAPAPPATSPARERSAAGGDATRWSLAGGVLALLLAAGAWWRARRSTSA